MKILSVTETTHAHCIYVAEHVRKEDADEIYAASGWDIDDAITYSWCRSEICFTGMTTENKLLIGIFGLRLEDWHWATPWMICTEEVKREWRPFLKTTKVIFSDLCKEYPNMRNWVDARHKKSIAWLKWLGFEISKPQPYGPFSMPFLMFSKEGEKIWEY